MSTNWPTWKENFKLEVMRKGENDQQSHEEVVGGIEKEKVLHHENRSGTVINRTELMGNHPKHTHINKEARWKCSLALSGKSA